MTSILVTDKMLETYNLYILFEYIRTEERRMNVTDPVRFFIVLIVLSIIGQAIGIL